MAGTTLFIRSLPFNDILIVLKGEYAGKATDEFVKWAESVQRQAANSPVVPQPAEELADIGANTSGNIGGALTAGMYRINLYREVTTQDPVSSSLDVTLTFTHNGKAMTRTFPTFAGTPQTTTDSQGEGEIIEIDPNTTIGYIVTYASNTPALARFQMTLLAELLSTLE